MKPRAAVHGDPPASDSCSEPRLAFFLRVFGYWLILICFFTSFIFLGGCVPGHTLSPAHVEVRGQLGGRGSSPFTHGVPGSNSGCQAWLQSPLPRSHVVSPWLSLCLLPSLPSLWSFGGQDVSSVLVPMSPQSVSLPPVKTTENHYPSHPHLAHSRCSIHAPRILQVGTSS